MSNTWSAFVVVIICGWFSYLVGKQYARSRRLNNLFWFVSLALAALASLCYCLTLWNHPHSAVAFQLYYVFGAMWMPAIMGLGSIGLLAGRKFTLSLAAVVAALGIVGSILLFLAPVNLSLLAALNGGAGTGVVVASLWLPFLIVLNTFGAAAVLIIALISAWKNRRKEASNRFFYGNLWLAAGVIVISAAGSAARLGWPGLFWITMLVGWVMTFFGYHLLSSEEKLAGTPRTTPQPTGR